MNSEEIARLREEQYNAKVLSVRPIHDDLMIVRVVPDQGPLSFQAGQYTLLGLGAWEPRVDGVTNDDVSPEARAKLVRRAYSISCPMLDDRHKLVTVGELPYLEFYIALVLRPSDDPPMLTPRLFGLKDGDRLFLGPRRTAGMCWMRSARRRRCSTSAQAPAKPRTTRTSRNSSATAIAA